MAKYAKLPLIFGGMVLCKSTCQGRIAKTKAESEYVKDQFKYQVTKYHLSGHLVFVTRRETNPAGLGALISVANQTDSIATILIRV